MLNTNLLKAEIIRNGLTRAEFCDKIGMSQSTFSRKLKSGVFNTTEVEKIITLLGVKSPNEIFFAQKLT